MAQDNTVTIVGNLTREPELRFTPSGQATATFGLAANRSWVDRQTQERKESTSFFDVVCWGSLAENVATSLQRGTRVVVTGRLDQRSWETQDGERRSKVEITAEEVAPSLRWATTTVTRNERRGGGGDHYDQRNQAAQHRPEPQPQPQSSGYAPQYSGPADEEEPF